MHFFCERHQLLLSIKNNRQIINKAIKTNDYLPGKPLSCLKAIEASLQ